MLDQTSGCRPLPATRSFSEPIICQETCRIRFSALVALHGVGLAVAARLLYHRWWNLLCHVVVPQLVPAGCAKFTLYNYVRARGSWNKSSVTLADSAWLLFDVENQRMTLWCSSRCGCGILVCNGRLAAAPSSLPTTVDFPLGTLGTLVPVSYPCTGLSDEPGHLSPTSCRCRRGTMNGASLVADLSGHHVPIAPVLRFQQLLLLLFTVLGGV